MIGISGDAFVHMLLHRNKFAYQVRKSCELALYELTCRIGKVYKKQEIALETFIDIELAFGSTSCDSIKRNVERSEVAPYLTRCSMLGKRVFKTSLGHATRVIVVRKGCAQPDILSPLPWSLTVDNLLRELNQEGLYAQGRYLPPGVR